MNRMSGMMDTLQKAVPEQVVGYRVIGHSDYETRTRFDGKEQGPIDLPKSNVLEYHMKNDCKLVVRPSGIEPKIKIYFSVCGAHREDALEVIGKLKEASPKLLGIQGLVQFT